MKKTRKLKKNLRYLLLWFGCKCFRSFLVYRLNHLQRKTIFSNPRRIYYEYFIVSFESTSILSRVPIYLTYFDNVIHFILSLQLYITNQYLLINTNSDILKYNSRLSWKISVLEIKKCVSMS